MTLNLPFPSSEEIPRKQETKVALSHAMCPL